jgi:hypothetical protein
MRLVGGAVAAYGVKPDRGSQLGFFVVSQTFLYDVNWNNAAEQR